MKKIEQKYESALQGLLRGSLALVLDWSITMLDKGHPVIKNLYTLY